MATALAPVEERVLATTPPEPRSRRRRAYELDLVRLVAAVLVVLYHYTWDGWSASNASPVRYTSGLTTFTRYGFLGVELFFLISGMVILTSATGRTPRQFAVSRFVRLYPVYWAMVTLTFVVTGVWGTHRLDVGIGDWAANLTMVEQLVPGRHHVHLVDGAYWTLTVELVFYALIWVTLMTRQLPRIVPVLSLWLAVSALVEVAGVGPLAGMRLYAATEYAPFFVAGACCSLIGVDRRRRSAWVLLGAATVLALHQTFIVVRGADLRIPGATYHPLVGPIVVLLSIGLVLAIALGRLRGLARPWMMTAGMLTYPLYLVHQYVGFVLFHHFRHLDPWILLVGVSAVVTAIAWLAHRLVERPLAPRLRRALEPRSRACSAAAGGPPADR